MRANKLCAVTFPLAATVLSAIPAASQTPQSALVNQRSQETLEAARAASPHTPDSAYAYFSDQAEAVMASAGERVWDPAQPREEPPRTAWGTPDLQGYWLNVSYTPRERPEELGDKALYTVEEAVQAFRIAVARDASVDPATVHYDWTEFGMDNWQSPIRPNRRTSLVVDPPNGRFPPLTPEGLARRRAPDQGGVTIEYRGLFERCITGNQGPPRLPIRQNTGESQIIQTPDHVVMITEANSEVRIFPIDGGEQLPGTIRNFLGDSRAHWEGDTLVVETTNFHPMRSAEDMHLVERFSRVAHDTLLYEATVTDLTRWEAPWTVEIPWPMMDPPGLFEFACHEQNYGIINVIRGAKARAAEYQAELEN